MEIVRLQKPAKKDTQNRKRNTKGNKTDHQAIWKGREPKRRLGRVGDLARQERAGWTRAREKMEGRWQAEQFGVLPEPWVKKNPTTHAHLPFSSPQGGEAGQ